MGADMHTSPDFSNAPSAGVRPVASMEMWEKKTEKNVEPLRVRSGSGASIWRSVVKIDDIPQRGFMQRQKYLVTGTVTVANGTGQVTVKDLWPHGFIDWCEFRANGSALHEVSGIGLHSLFQRRYRNPSLTSVLVDELAADLTPANGDYDFSYVMELPLCYDYTNGIGGVYAESRGASFVANLTLAEKARLFSFTNNADVTVSYQIEPLHYFFDIPRDNVDGVEVLYLPDMSRLFQIQEKREAIVAAGSDTSVEIDNTRGNLTCLTMHVRNNNAQVDPSTLNHVKWNYGTNQTPRNYDPVELLLHDNVLDYGGALPYQSFALDFESENARRDSTRPSTVTQLQAKLGIPSTMTLAADPEVRAIQEFLILASNSPNVTVPPTAA